MDARTTVACGDVGELDPAAGRGGGRTRRVGTRGRGVLGDQGLGLLTIAFAAGFSERVILRFIPDTPDISGRPDEPGAEGPQTEPPEGKASS